MKVVPVALVVVLLAWVMLICAATTTSSEITRRKSQPRPQPIELNLAVTSANVAEAQTRYSNFIAALLVNLKDPSKSFFGIPVLGTPSPREPEYMYVKIISATGKSIVLGINKKNIYVDGYNYKDGTEARCFKDVFKKCTAIFPTVNPNKVQDIGFGGSYPELQEKAGLAEGREERMKVPLGMKTLGSFIDKISVTQPSTIPTDEAKLLLIVIQMVSEAVRFKYIKNQVRDNIPNDFNPDPKLIILENKWRKLSSAIAGADSKTGKFKNSIKLKDAKNEDWVVDYVACIEPDMGLLLNSVRASELPKWLLDDNVPVSAQ